MELRVRAAAAPAPARRQVRRDIMILRDKKCTQDVPHKRYDLDHEGDKHLSLPKSKEEQGYEGRQHGNTKGRWAGDKEFPDLLLPRMCL